MCRTNNYILRITNTALASDSITINASKSKVSFDTPDYLRYYTETRGANTVLGTCPTVYTGAGATDGYNGPFTSITPLIFTCPELPPVIEVERMVYNTTVLEALGSTNIVPFYVELDIQFFEDMK